MKKIMFLFGKWNIFCIFAGTKFKIHYDKRRMEKCSWI